MSDEEAAAAILMTAIDGAVLSIVEWTPDRAEYVVTLTCDGARSMELGRMLEIFVNGTLVEVMFSTDEDPPRHLSHSVELPEHQPFPEATNAVVWSAAVMVANGLYANRRQRG